MMNNTIQTTVNINLTNTSKSIKFKMHYIMNK